MRISWSRYVRATYMRSHRRSPHFCKAQHLLVSLDGDLRGFVDELLAKRGLQRRIVLTVPTFMMALPHLSSSDLIAALPRRLVERHAARLALAVVELPLQVRSDPGRRDQSGKSWMPVLHG